MHSAKDQVFHCLVLEDDNNSQEMIKDIIERKYPEIVPHAAKTLKEAKTIYDLIKPQMMVLDINLPDGHSFEFLSEIDPVDLIKCKVIFTTAYSKFAIEAFKFSALDYLLKPFTPQELEKSIDIALLKFNHDYYHAQLETFFYNYRENENQNKKLVLKSTDSIVVVKMADIYHCEADNNYTIFHLTDGKRILVSLPLKSYEIKLQTNGFMRVHQSHLVNMHHVKSFHRKTNCLLLINDMIVPVSQNKKPGVLYYLNNL